MNIVSMLLSVGFPFLFIKLHDIEHKNNNEVQEYHEGTKDVAAKVNDIQNDYSQEGQESEHDFFNSFEKLLGWDFLFLSLFE